MRIDLTALADIADSPRVRDAQRALAEAERRQTDSETKCVAAENELDHLERAAAAGNRDDKRLKAAREQVVHWQGELRIAAHGVVNARAIAETTYREVCIEVHAAFVEAHHAAMHRLDAALAEARRHSHEITVLEDATSRLFAGGPYRKWPGRPLSHTAWSREFGGPTGNQADTRYMLWRKHCGVFTD